MKTVNQILLPDEKVVYEGRPKYKPFTLGAVIFSLIPSFILGGITTIISKNSGVGVIVGVIVFCLIRFLVYTAYRHMLYVVTDKRVIIQSWIIGIDFKSIDYNRIQNMSVDVGLIGVMFKVGTIKIFTGEMQAVSNGNNGMGMQSKYDRLMYVENPYEVLKILQTQLYARK